MSAALSLGFSPCPNDCFMFDAMVHGKVDTEGLSFDWLMTDVEDLNRKALKEKLDVTKLSFFAFTRLTGKYALLDAGSALGEGCGPILIAKPDTIQPKIVAIPGIHTTANLLFSLAFPKAQNKVEMVFSEIEDAVLSGRADAGVIIHENRFTYEQKGLIKLLDLGEYWEKTTQAPIPLGGIVVKRTLAPELREKLNRVLKRSIAFAFANPSDSYSFVKANAQELSEEVVNRHIQLYVNDYSLSLGDKGRQAIELLFSKAAPATDINTIYA
jgi:1,4-dihydroxy-6-naphthoate synthase